MMTALQSISLDCVAGYGALTADGEGAFHSWAEALLDVKNDKPEYLTHGWRKALAEFPGAQRKFDGFYEQLTKLAEFCPAQKHVIHSDLLYQNLLVHDHQISAVLDWGCAMIGDPVYDLAIFAFFEPWYPAFTEVGLIERMRQSYLEQSPNNRLNYDKRMLACQIHLTLGNIAFCALSEGKFDFYEHINRLDDVLSKTDMKI
jgi:hygromycin-B 4-O-kinase